jgi:hypothetical protein
MITANFVTTLLVADREGVDRTTAMRLAVLASLIPGPAGMLVGITAVRREAPPPPRRPDTPSQGEVARIK